MRSGKSQQWTVRGTWVLVVLFGCSSREAPRSSFYDERIAPILKVGCVQQTTGCHLPDARGVAAGNLDLSTFDGLMRRSDVLSPYGPYTESLLLLKAGQSIDIPVETFDPSHPLVTVHTDIRHAAGAGIGLDSSGRAQIQRWIRSGFTRTSVPPNTRSESLGDCSNGIRTAVGFDPSQEPVDEDGYDLFVSDVQPVLRERCAGSGCHGSRITEFYLSCGNSEEERRWNYFSSLEQLSAPASTSELLNRPLATTAGGAFHEGGDVFMSTSDRHYRALLGWAEDVVSRRPDLLVDTDSDPGLRFFADRVQPVLVRKGCMFLNCHSPSMFHDLRLRGGARGSFSEFATRRNYELSRLQLATESLNPNNSRIIAKNLFPAKELLGADGIAHRGGSLLEDFGRSGVTNPATPDDCIGVDADGGDINTVPAYCVLVRWHQIERDQAIARGDVSSTLVRSVVWVSRPRSVGNSLEFDTFRGGADLRMASASVASDGALSLGASQSKLGGCGLSTSGDVRNPAVSWDGTKIAFAARATANDPLRIYWMNADGSNCERAPGLAASSNRENGILIHDFDPAFAPDGRIVFASTRGNLDGGRYSYQGPTRTPASLAPNANLYVFEDGHVRQLTFLLNQEVSPSFMADGRLIFSTEKREPGFHQVAGRRQNLDGGDYHPLFAQRGSVGFQMAADIVEMPNRNLAFAASPLDASDGGAAIAIVNRSVGPDQSDRDPADLFYVHSLEFPIPGAGLPGVYPTLPGAPSQGVFRSPSPLPTGRLLVACDAAATDVRTGSFDYEICELDLRRGAVRRIAGTVGVADMDPVAVYARANHGVFQSRLDEANGSSSIDSSETRSVVHVTDFPLLATLLFSNTRTGRPIDYRIGSFDVFEALPPPSDASAFDSLPALSDINSYASSNGGVLNDAFGSVWVKYRRLGRVPLFGDGSAKFRVQGGTPIVLRPLDGDDHVLTFGEGAPFSGEMIQREQMQFYPGEHSTQSFRRTLFNGMCGTCHGSISNRELDNAVRIDVLTRASVTAAKDASPIDLIP